MDFSTIIAAFQSVLNFNNLLEFFKKLLTPPVKLTLFLLSLGGWISAAIAKPQGFFNWIICWMIDIISAVLPETPENLKVSSMVEAISDKMPAVGTALIWDIVESLIIVIGIGIVIKVYKLLPFKAT